MTTLRSRMIFVLIVGRVKDGEGLKTMCRDFLAPEMCLLCVL